MPKGYWIVHIDLTGQEQFAKYVLANADALEKHGTKFLARAGRYAVPEGTNRARNTIVEFPSYQAALDCWNSLEYQAALRLRLPAAAVDIVIVEGYDGPQPS